VGTLHFARQARPSLSELPEKFVWLWSMEGRCQPIRTPCVRRLTSSHLYRTYRRHPGAGRDPGHQAVTPHLRHSSFRWNDGGMVHRSGSSHEGAGLGPGFRRDDN